MSTRKGKPIVKSRQTPVINVSQEFNYTLTQAFDYFIGLKKAEGVRDRTMQDYYTLFEYFTEWLAPKYPQLDKVNDITKAIIREYVVYLSEEKLNARTGQRGLSPYTVNVRVRFLKVFFNALVSEELINRNPVDNVKLMRVDEDTYEPLDDREIEKLLAQPNVREYAQFRDYVIIYLILDTGMRINEVCHLENEDIDFKTRSILLPASKNKNRKPRIIPLSNYVLKLLMELVTENKTHFNTSYVFLANNGNRYNPNSFRRRLTIYKEKAGINKRVSPHAFRHLFCRNYILNGGDIFTLQRIVGHANITTTRKYIQMDAESLKNQHAQFSPVLRIRNKYKR